MGKSQPTYIKEFKRQAVTLFFLANISLSASSLAASDFFV